MLALAAADRGYGNRRDRTGHQRRFRQRPQQTGHYGTGSVIHVPEYLAGDKIRIHIAERRP